MPDIIIDNRRPAVGRDLAPRFDLFLERSSRISPADSDRIKIQVGEKAAPVRLSPCLYHYFRVDLPSSGQSLAGTAVLSLFITSEEISAAAAEQQIDPLFNCGRDSD